MKIFLDTAHIDDIMQWNATGLLDGITTNPTSVAKEGGLPKDTITKIVQSLPGKDVSVEVTETDPIKVYEQAKRIASLADNVVVKIPCHINYYPIIQKLTSEGMQINVTLLFTLMQGLHMSKLGVKYISPFIGRSDDIAMDGVQLLHELRAMIDRYNYKTQILAASIRTVDQYHQAINTGADVATMPVKVLAKATDHPLTNKGIQLFEDDWKSLGNVPFI